MYTLAQLADVLDGAGHGNAQHAVSSISSLARAHSSQLAYFTNPLLKPLLQSTKAGIVLLKSEHLVCCPVNAIVVSQPLAAIQKIAALLHPPGANIPDGIHSTAQIHPFASIGNGVSIGAHTVISEHAVLSDGVVIGPNSLVAAGVRVGKNSQIGSNVSVHQETQIGKDVVISSGCVLGSPPFNCFKEQGLWQQGVALGGVTVLDRVHIGANTVIDRGSVGDTYLAQGVCIDNLVHIAHDAYIGANTAIAGCAVVGAHTVVGSDCIIGGASSIAAYLHLVDDVVISGMTTVSKSVTKPGIYSSGTLAHEHQRWRKNAARFKRLDEYMTKLHALERRVSSES